MEIILMKKKKVAVLVVSCVYLISIFIPLFGVAMIIQILLLTAAIMHFWQVDLNPLSSVNLVMGVGVAVEFFTHVSRVFLLSPKTSSYARVVEAVKSMGVPVFMGGFATFLSVLILAAAQYPVFQIYYFRMYLLLTVLGICYGLILVPVFLSFLPDNYGRRGKYNWRTTDSSRELDSPEEKRISY